MFYNQYFHDIKKFNIERNLLNSKTFNITTELSFIYEEISEGLRNYKDLHQVLDAYGDIIVFSVGSLLKLGVEDPEIFVSNLWESLDSDVSDTKFVMLDTVDKVLYADVQSESRFDDMMLSIRDSVYVYIVSSKDMGFIHPLIRFNELASMISNFIIQGDSVIKTEYLKLLFYTIIYHTIVSIEFMGYRSDCIVSEITKHILSRKGKFNENTGKWEKDKNQDPSTLYQPDFTKCKNESVDMIVEFV